MSLMDVVSGAGLAMWAELALVLFFFAFLGLLLYLTLSANRELMERGRMMPFADEELSAGQPEVKR